MAALLLVASAFVVGGLVGLDDLGLGEGEHPAGGLGGDGGRDGVVDDVHDLG